MGTYGFRDVQLASFKPQAGEECYGGWWGSNRVSNPVSLSGLALNEKGKYACRKLRMGLHCTTVCARLPGIL